MSIHLAAIRRMRGLPPDMSASEVDEINRRAERLLAERDPVEDFAPPNPYRIPRPTRPLFTVSDRDEIGNFALNITAVPQPEDTKPTVLDEAAEKIFGERQQQYGDPSESFDRIAQFWSSYLGHQVTSLDVANMMILMKVSRAKNGYHRDTYVDIAGYSGSAERVMA